MWHIDAPLEVLKVRIKTDDLKSLSVFLLIFTINFVIISFICKLIILLQLAVK